MRRATDPQAGDTGKAKRELEERLTALFRPLIAGRGLTLWGLELSGGPGGPVLRVYIDSEDRVTVGNCADVSRDLSALLDVEDPVPGRYSLEVSSPGLERVFFRADQMPAYVGRTVEVTLSEPVEGRRNFLGTLAAVHGDDVTVETPEGTTLTIDFARIRKVRLRHEFQPSGSGAAGRRPS